MDPVFELLQEGLLGIEPQGELGIGDQRGLRLGLNRCGQRADEAQTEEVELREREHLSDAREKSGGFVSGPNARWQLPSVEEMNYTLEFARVVVKTAH